MEIGNITGVKPQKKDTKKSDRITCYYCKEKGHITKLCPKKKGSGNAYPRH